MISVVWSCNILQFLAIFRSYLLLKSHLGLLLFNSLQGPFPNGCLFFCFVVKIVKYRGSVYGHRKKIKMFSFLLLMPHYIASMAYHFIVILALRQRESLFPTLDIGCASINLNVICLWPCFCRW